MHLAYIISAYKNLSQLERLVRLLGSDGSRVVVHVDRKTSNPSYDELVTSLAGFEPVRFLDRHRCHYGGFGHVRASLKGIAELLRTGTAFDYALLLTGQDYPIKPLEQIHRFLEEHRGSSFMGNDRLPSPRWSPRGGLDRIEFRHVRLYGRHLRLPGRRRFPAGLRPYGGGAYWCLSRACVEHVAAFVDARPDVVHFFHRVDVPDEIFFQTVLMNSEHAASIVDENLRYIDWSRGPRPAVLGVEDLDALRRSPKLFARKFDLTEDAEILDRIDRDLLARAE